MVSVSIIIPSCNRSERKKLLEENLKNIEKQKFNGDLEVVVVNDKPSSPASLRNLGISRSKGDILIFLDDDSVVQNSDYVQKMAEGFKEKGVGIVAGKTLDFYSGVLKFIRAGDLPEIDFNNPAGFTQVEGVPTKNAAFLKRAVLEAGGFNPAFNFLGEDLDLCLRIKKLGYKLAFNEYALVYHYPTSTFWGYVKKQYDIGFSHGVIHSFYPDKSPKISFLKIIISPLLAVRNFIVKTKICFAKKLFTRLILKELGLMFLLIIASYCANSIGEISYLVRKIYVSAGIRLKVMGDLGSYFVGWLKYFIKANLLPQRRMFILYLTNRCNNRCRHCFYSESINKNVQELSLNDLDKIAKNYFSYTNIHKSLAKSIWQGFTGGEPFLRNDLLEIVFLFKDAGVENFQFNTNAMLTDKILNFSREMLKRNTPLKIIISLDGLKETHDKVRNTSGAFENAIKTIKGLKNLGIEVGTITTINKLNYKEIPNVVKFVNDDLGIEPGLQLIRGVSQSDAPMEFGDTADPLEKNVLISKDIIPEIRSILFKIYSEKSIREPYHLTEFARRLTYLECHLDILEKGKRLFNCMAGKSVGVIYQNGDVSLCEFYKPIGNLKSVDFNLSALWHNSEAEKQRAAVKKCFCHHDCFINTEYNSRFAKRFLNNIVKFTSYV